MSCGFSDKRPNRAELALERAQFVLLSEGLQAAQGAVQQEVTASRAVWPTVARGLPSFPSRDIRQRTARASAQAARLPEPSFMTSASRLTGPAAGLAGLYETFARLTERGWRMIEATLHSLAAGSPPAARFARENSPLYIDAIYDGHFDLSLAGKSIAEGYKRLGGPSAFGARLSQAEIDALARAYSIPAVRLTPHPAASIESP